jgi:hypothetical protein
MGYPAATGRGLPLRTKETLHRRPYDGTIPPELRGARRPSVPALAQQGWVACNNDHTVRSLFWEYYIRQDKVRPAQIPCSGAERPN